MTPDDHSGTKAQTMEDVPAHRRNYEVTNGHTLEDSMLTERGLSKESNSSLKVSLRGRAQHFAWAWFSTTMATGSVAVVLNQTPDQFTGLITIGKIFFILDLVHFLTFATMIIIRFTIVPRALTKSLHHPTESFFFGTFWVSISLILQCTALYGGPSSGPRLTKALEICFWLYTGLIMLVAIFQYHTLFITEHFQITDMVPAWILPIYPLLVAGPLAGVLLSNQPSSPALPIFVGGIAMQGLGWMVATFMYAIWTIRLMSADVPAPPTRPGAYVSVGPTGYTAQALLTLGSRAPTVVPTGFLGVPDSVPVGYILNPRECSRHVSLAVGVLVLCSHDRRRHTGEQADEIHTDMVGVCAPECWAHAEPDPDWERA